jgi:hypothetical protein
MPWIDFSKALLVLISLRGSELVDDMILGCTVGERDGLMDGVCETQYWSSLQSNRFVKNYKLHSSYMIVSIFAL